MLYGRIGRRRHAWNDLVHIQGMVDGAMLGMIGLSCKAWKGSVTHMIWFTSM